MGAGLQINVAWSFLNEIFLLNHSETAHGRKSRQHAVSPRAGYQLVNNDR